MGYYIDLKSITLMQYKQSLKNGYLPPSRQVLKENIDERFERIEKQGIETAEELLAAVKTKNKVESFSVKSGIDPQYVTLLSREIRSLVKKPVKLSEFSMISEETADKLEKAGINNTAIVYGKVLKPRDRKKLSQNTGIDINEIETIAAIVDISRIRWVNHTFSEMLFELDFRSAKEVAEADSETLYKQVNELNKQKGIFKGSIGLNDIRVCIEAAGALTHELE